MIRESCPYCGKMTDMTLKKGVWVSGTCIECGKDLTKINVPELTDAEIDLKAPPEVILP